MDQQFPPPSSDDHMGSLDQSTATVHRPVRSPVSAELPRAPRRDASMVQDTEAPTMSSVAPIYRPEGLPGNVLGAASTVADAGQAATTASATSQSGPVEKESPSGGHPAPTQPDAPGGEPAAAKAPRLRPRRRSRVRLRHLLPAWCVSLMVHVVILSALAAATFSNQDAARPFVSFDSALADLRNGELQEAPILAEPSNIPRKEAVGTVRGGPEEDAAPEMIADGGPEGDAGDGGGTVVGTAFGAVPPSQTPRFLGRGRGGINEANSLPHLKLEGMARSPINTLPPNPAANLIGVGVGGDPTFHVKTIGEGLDQLAREILLRLKEHKLTVVWMFDESISMKDDQRAILNQFDRVSADINKNIEPGKKAAGALAHAIVGFGKNSNYVIKPTVDMDEIGRGIKKLPEDHSGVENTMQAIRETVEVFAGIAKEKDRKLMLVLVTDESGDDGADVEEARQALAKHKVSLFVIGRQSLFGYPFAHHRFQDLVTKDVYHPLIRRGPESADFEIYQWDGLYDRWDEQPSGFAPWELARLTKDSGGMYFLLPSEEFMRVRQREQAYSSEQLREFRPEYDNRLRYVQNRTASPLKRSLYEIISETKKFIYRREFPIDSAEQARAAAEEAEKAGAKLKALLAVQEHLEKLKGLRDHEPSRRWQAHYDLILAQTVAFQVKAFEYQALMVQLAERPRTPSKQPTPDLSIDFVVDHSQKPLAPQGLTAKKYAEARRLLDDVIARYPNTPWADLAKDTLARGFSVVFNEWHHNPEYAKRAQFVPKY
ncbi:MAG: hypothetical protein U0790_24875 [Isosphaeraceae bacterium]